MACVQRIISACAVAPRTPRRRQSTTAVNRRSRSKFVQKGRARNEAHEMDGHYPLTDRRVVKGSDRRNTRLSSAILTLLKYSCGFPKNSIIATSPRMYD
jgi:hypothetical protein